MDWEARAKQLRVDIPAIYIAMHKKETPRAAKIMTIVIVGYALSPIDIIPDDMMAGYRMEAEGLWDDKKPQKWYYAIPVVIIWLILLWVLLLLLGVAT